MNQRPFALLESHHDGELPVARSFAAVSGDSVVATVVKPAEGGDDYIVRAYETAGRPARVTIALPFLDREIEADFGPAEIKTLRVPRDASRPATITDLIEGLATNDPRARYEIDG